MNNIFGIVILVVWYIQHIHSSYIQALNQYFPSVRSRGCDLFLRQHLPNNISSINSFIFTVLLYTCKRNYICNRIIGIIVAVIYGIIFVQALNEDWNKPHIHYVSNGICFYFIILLIYYVWRQNLFTFIVFVTDTAAGNNGNGYYK